MRAIQFKLLFFDSLKIVNGYILRKEYDKQEKELTFYLQKDSAEIQEKGAEVLKCELLIHDNTKIVEYKKNITLKLQNDKLYILPLIL